MSRVAILADVHGNVPALEAVLADLRTARVDEVIAAGDLVGRGPQGNSVVRRIREYGWTCVRGNHEDYLLDFRHGRVPAPWLHLEEWSASRWMAAELDDDAVAWIDGLPAMTRSQGEPGLVVVHGSPRSNNEGLGPWTSDEVLDARLVEVAGEVLACAHTHRSMERRVPNGLVVNVGAVGLPFNRDRRAQYAILERTPGGWTVELRRVAYDVQHTLDIYRTSGFLAAGGITARLLAMELHQAAPFLVPFMKWATARARPAEASQIPHFLAVYDIEQPMSAFLSSLQQDGD